MEFFDFTGTNEEEKAQALDIISHRETSAVEFFINYNVSGWSNRPNNHWNPKSTYLHANGDMNDLETPSPDQNSNLAPGSNPNYGSESPNGSQQHHQPPLHHHHHHHHNYNEWEPPPPPNSGATPATSSPIMMSNIATHQYVITGGGPPPPHHPYGFPPPHNPYAIHHPALQPAPLAPPHTISTNQSKPICLQAPVLPANIVSSAATTSQNSKNISKNTNTTTSSSCDIIRNQNSMYMPPPNSQYSTGAPQPMMDGSRRKNHQMNSSLPIQQHDEDGGNTMISDPNMVPNGGGAAGGSTALPLPPPPHISPAAYPGYAFQPPHALYPPHHFSHQPIYYVPHPESFMPYPPPFSPSTAPPHISPIPAAAAHHSNHLQQQPHQNVIPTSPVEMPPVIPAQVSSSPAAATASAATSAVPSNLSSASTYHLTDSTKPVFETICATPPQSSNPPAESSNSPINSTADERMVAVVEDEKPSSPTLLQVPSFSQSSSSPLDQQKQSSSQQPEVLSESHIVVNSSSNNETSPSDKQVSNLEKYFKSCLSNSRDKNVAEDIMAAPDAVPSANETTTTTVDSEPVKNASTAADQSLKVTTWASKLFPNANPNSSGNETSSSNHKSSNNEKSSESTAATRETKLQNGDYPELNMLGKSSAGNPATRNHMFSRRGGVSSHRLAFDDPTADKKLNIIAMKNDPIALKLAKRLRDSIHLKHSLPTIMPCGLINRGNWCYVNATMQALLACPPFYNLMREIGETSGLFRQSTSTPIIDNFARYFSKFLPNDHRRQMKSAGGPFLEDLLNTDPFEPMFIYDSLKHIGMIKNDAQRGHQEDAEEFLSSVLNGLHEEMISLSKFLAENDVLKEKKAAVEGGKTNGFGSGDEVTLDAGEADVDDENCSDNNDNIWREVGNSKHKSLPTRSTKTVTTAITEIFGGSTLDIRTVNKDKDSCGNRQPFFTLQLDIKPQTIKTLDDAIRWQTRSETIHGYTCSKTKQIVDASSQMFLENLPPILIFHLKLFEYDIETGAGKKLLKSIEFSENIEIPRECVTGRPDNRFRRYKLLAVVYHNGSEAVNGHYITDVYHLGLNQWLRCDDSSIKVISIQKVLNGKDREGNLVPYLLFYRRYDTLHSQNPSVFNATGMMNLSGPTSGGKRSSSSSINNNMDHGFHHHSHHHHSSNQTGSSSSNSGHHPAMTTTNKFNSISRHF